MPESQGLWPGSQGLRRQALDDPAIIPAPVTQAVMKTIGTRLPEFDGLRDEHVPAPEVGHRHARRGRPALLELGHPAVKLRAGPDDLRLPAGPRSDLRPARPGEELRLAAGLRHRAHAALGGHLAAERVPGEDGTRPRTRGQVLALARGPVAVEG